MGLCLKDPFNEFCCIVPNIFCPSDISLRIPLLDIAVSRCQVLFIGGISIAFSFTHMDGYSLVVGIDLHLVRIVMDLYPLVNGYTPSLYFILPFRYFVLLTIGPAHSLDRYHRKNEQVSDFIRV